MTYANEQERSDLIAGLRDLADFLEGRPQVPAPRWAGLMVFPSAAAESEMRLEVDGIAVLIGSGIDDQIPGFDHYATSRSFGPVQYRAVAIPPQSRTENDRALIDGEV